MNSYRILFNPRRPYFLEPIIPVYECLEAQGHMPVISGMEAETDSAFQEYLQEHNLSVRYLSADASADQQWDLVVLGGRLYERAFTYPQHFAFLNHGGSNGGNGIRPYTLESFLHEDMDAYLALSQGTLDFGERYQSGMWDNKIIKVVGWPKLDKAFTQGAQLRKQLHDQLQLDPKKPVVVFTSHWQTNSLLRTIGLNVLQVLAHDTTIQRKTQVVVTCHPLIFSDVRNVFGGDPEGLLSQFCRKPHMHFVPTCDSISLVLLGDIFLTDNSSIICEIAALGKEIISCLPPTYRFSDPVMQEYLANASLPLKVPADLPELIEQLLEPSKERKAALQKLADYSYVNLGCAAPAVAQAIVEVIETLANDSYHQAL